MGWSDIPSEIRGIVASSVEPFEADTVANANDVVALGARMSLPVAGVAKGYWSTISFGWGDVEVEVFADHVELYDLANGEMDL